MTYLALYVLAARIFCICSLLVNITCLATNQRTTGSRVRDLRRLQKNNRQQDSGWPMGDGPRDRSRKPSGGGGYLLPSWQGGLVKLPSYDQNSLNLSTLDRPSVKDRVTSIVAVSLNLMRGDGNWLTKASLVLPGSSMIARTAFSWPSASTCTRCSSARVR